MKRFLSCIALLLILAVPAMAWQSIVGSVSGTPVKVKLISATTYAADSSSPAVALQLKNTGVGTLTASFWKYDLGVDRWAATHPFGAHVDGHPFYAVCDSIMTLGSGETFAFDEPSQRGAHVVVLDGTTTYTIVYK
jgi:hypothetical protein